MKRPVTFLRLTITSLGIFFAVSCATLTSDIDIETHSAADADLDKYKTYVIGNSAQIIFDPVGQWEQPTHDSDEFVRSAVNRELRHHGLHQVTENPDLTVVFAAGIDTAALELRYSPEHDRKVLQNIPTAALVVALIDNKTGYLVWIGYAVGEAQRKRPLEDIQARINYAVHEIFDDYD